VLILRAVELSDADAYADVIRQIHPDELVDAAVLRERWNEEAKHPDDQRRYLIVDADRVMGIAFWNKPGMWILGEPRLANVNVRLVPTRQLAMGFARLLAQMEDEAREAGADLARAVTREDETFHPEMLGRAGYRVDRVSRAWELDLVAERRKILSAMWGARMAMATLDLRLTTIDRADDDGTWRRLYELTAETIPDIPSTVREPVPSFSSWLRRMKSPDIFSDRIWIGYANDKPIAYSYLTYPQVGSVTSGYTATARAWRGRGVAQAVKLESAAQAMRLGIERIRTDNDLENSAMIHINQVMGYRPLPGLVTHLKSLA